MKNKRTDTQIISDIIVDPNGTNGFEEESLRNFLASHYDINIWREDLLKDILSYRVTVARNQTAVKYSTYGIATFIAIAGAAGLSFEKNNDSDSLKNTVTSCLQIVFAVSLMATKAICDPWAQMAGEVVKRLEAILAYGDKNKLHHTYNWVEESQRSQAETSVQNNTQGGLAARPNMIATLAKSMNQSVLAPKNSPNDLSITINSEQKDSPRKLSMTS